MTSPATQIPLFPDTRMRRSVFDPVPEGWCVVYPCTKDAEVFFKHEVRTCTEHARGFEALGWEQRR